MSEDKIQNTKEAMYKFSQAKTLSEIEQTILRNGANSINQLQQENKELNFILTELEKWLEDKLKESENRTDIFHNFLGIKEVLDKLQELEEIIK